jgi:predicted phosphodiesterase
MALHLWGTPVRILHLADLHGLLSWFRWARTTACHYDLVCITGDLLGPCDEEDLQTPAEQVSAELRDFPGPLALCSGNHDLMPGDEAGASLWLRRRRRPNVWIDGDTFVLRGQPFCCIGWGSSLLPAAPGEIWLAHAPPDGCAPGNHRLGGDGGDFELGELCRAGLGPWLVLAGHVHEPAQWHGVAGATRVLNPGRSNVAPFPNHIGIDLLRDLAKWRRFCCPQASKSLPGSLKCPLVGVAETELKPLYGSGHANSVTKGLMGARIEAIEVR